MAMAFSWLTAPTSLLLSLLRHSVIVITLPMVRLQLYSFQQPGSGVRGGRPGEQRGHGGGGGGGRGRHQARAPALHRRGQVTMAVMWCEETECKWYGCRKTFLCPLVTCVLLCEMPEMNYSSVCGVEVIFRNQISVLVYLKTTHSPLVPQKVPSEGS